MCRNIKTLFNFDPPATDEEIRAVEAERFNSPSKRTQRRSIARSTTSRRSPDAD
jgi:hypothetical protein